jgi:GDP-D-mannose dehydratase
MSKVILPTSFEGKTILVAGAAGFVPSTLCEFYLNLGAHVIGIFFQLTKISNFINIIFMSAFRILKIKKLIIFYQWPVQLHLLISPLFQLKLCV